MRLLVSTDRFVEAWNASASPAELAVALGVSLSYVRARTHALRNAGVIPAYSPANLVAKCVVCGKEFKTYPSEVKKGKKACSHECGRKCMVLTTHRMSNTRLHEIWCHIKTRCYCETSPVFSYYGGRGIRVCDEWMESFLTFSDWALSNGYKEDLELDRRDVNGNYEPGNCRWANRFQQMWNTRKRKNAVTSKFKGVSLHRQSGKWRVQIQCNRKHYDVGMYSDEIEAAKAYDEKARELFGEYAHTNFSRMESASY